MERLSSLQDFRCLALNFPWDLHPRLAHAVPIGTKTKTIALRLRNLVQLSLPSCAHKLPDADATRLNTFKKILTVLYFVFNVYAFGGGVMQGVMNYPAWKLIGAEEFPAFHQSIDSRIFVFFVPIFFLSVPISILMIWFGHPSISRRLIVLMALLNLSIFLVTIFLAIPIQDQLALGKSVEQIDALIFYDRYFRIVPGFCGVIVTSLMLYQVQNRPATSAS